MRTYEFRLTIHEGSDEFWDELNETGKSGVDEVYDMVKEALAQYGGFYDHYELAISRYSNE